MDENIDTAGAKGGMPPARGSEPAQDVPINRDGYSGAPSKSMFLKHVIPFHRMEREFVDRDFYVLNNSIEKIGMTMRVGTTIRAVDGSEIVIIVPQTWLPVNLSEQASNRDLLHSNALRNSNAQRMLLIVDPDFAENIRSTTHGQQELMRLARTGNDISNYADILTGKAEVDPRKIAEYRAPEVPAHIRETEGVRPDIVSAVNTGDVPSLVTALNLAIYNEDLRPNEVRYVRSKNPHRDVLRLLEGHPA